MDGRIDGADRQALPKSIEVAIFERQRGRSRRGKCLGYNNVVIEMVISQIDGDGAFE